MLRLPICIACLACLLPGAHAQAPQTPQAPPAPVDTRTVHWQLGTETVGLPAGERMGLMGGTLLFDQVDGWAWGPGVYAAARGRRGGLFVGGVAVQRRWEGPGGWSATAGLFAGGGGGADAPVGSGLMLRPSVQLGYALADGVEAGVSLSQVRFPSGDIRGTQWGLVMSWSDRFRSVPPPQTPRWATSIGSSGLGAASLSATLSSVALRDGSQRQVKLVGARAEWRRPDSAFSWGAESAGAAGGGAAGYMEVLGTGAWRFSPSPAALPGLRLGVRAAVGLGGGGAVNTAGGAIARLAGTAQWQHQEWTLGVESGAVTGSGPGYRGRHNQLWLAMDLDRPQGQPARLVRTEWTMAIQRYDHAARADGHAGPLSTVGLKLARQVGEHLYLTGQAHSAYGGGFGAYSSGFVGAGLVQRLSPHWRAGGELLIGAAGGAGVRTGGGALGQGVLWAGWSEGPARPEWRVGLGALRALRGEIRTPLVELSWTMPFGQTGP